MIEELSSIRVNIQSMIDTKLKLKNDFNDKVLLAQKSQDNEETNESNVWKEKYLKLQTKTDKFLTEIWKMKEFHQSFVTNEETKELYYELRDLKH